MKFFALCISLLLVSNSAFAAPDVLCPNAHDQSAVADCMHDKLQKAKTELAKAEQKALADAKEDDKIAPTYQNEQALIDSNKAFETYREAECVRQTSLTLNRSVGAGINQAKCEIDFIKARIYTLKNRQ